VVQTGHTAWHSFCARLCSQGFAYLEFLEKDAVDNAILLDNTELRGRQLKVGGCWAVACMPGGCHPPAPLAWRLAGDQSEPLLAQVTPKRTNVPGLKRGRGRGRGRGGHHGGYGYGGYGGFTPRGRG
jgi:polyadenylate-binding protein 2